MRTTLFAPLLLLALAACSGGKDGDTKDDPCAVSGNICLFSGIPGVAEYSADDIPATEAGMYLPLDLTFAPDDTAYVIDWNNHRIRHIDDQGIIHTVAGSGFLGDGPPGPALANSFNHPANLAFDPDDPDKIAIAAWHNSRVEELDLATETMSWLAGTGDRSYNGPCDAKHACSGMDTILDLPSSVAWDDVTHELYFMDQANQLIRKIDDAGNVTDVGGGQRLTGYAGDGGLLGSQTRFWAATGQAADPSNRFVIKDHVLTMVDTGNYILRQVDLDTMIIDRYAGQPYEGYAGDGGDAMQAQFDTPRDLAWGIDGELYVADTDNSCIRVIKDGIIDTFAGQCTVDGYDGDEGPATEAVLQRPYGVAVDQEGNVYVADTYNMVIRKITH